GAELDGAGLGLDLHGALGDEEHAGPFRPRLNEDLPLGCLDLLRRLRDVLELLVAEVCEQRYAPERFDAPVHHIPGRPRPWRPPRAGPSFDSISPCAERSASFTAATTMSSSISGSFGSIAFGSILIDLISPPPVAVTVTIPPPALASTVSFLSSSPSRVAFFGSSASWRWKDAAWGNSTVSRSPARPFGCASRSTDAVGIDFSSTAGRIVRCQASCSCSSSSEGVSAGSSAGGVSSGRGPGTVPGTWPGWAPRSRSSRRCAVDSRERSAAGRVTFTSASSSGSRGP